MPSVSFYKAERLARPIRPNAYRLACRRRVFCPQSGAKCLYIIDCRPNAEPVAFFCPSARCRWDFCLASVWYILSTNGREVITPLSAEGREFRLVVLFVWARSALSNRRYNIDSRAMAEHEVFFVRAQSGHCRWDFCPSAKHVHYFIWSFSIGHAAWEHAMTIGNRLFYFQTNPINTKHWQKKVRSKVTFLSVWFVAICVCLYVCMYVSSPQPTPFELGTWNLNIVLC